MDEREALLHVIALLDKLPGEVIDTGLEEIDLSDDAWEQALQILKDKVGWKDNTVSETDEE